MRILQLIDSLAAGGAERMAVNYANVLAETLSFSALVTTRAEGALKEQLAADVSYLFLNKKGVLDFPAVFRLRNFVKQNRISIIHAHSTSFFTAVCVKFLCPKVKIIWHDHYGDSMFLKQRSAFVLQLASVFFQGILAVNLDLKQWSLDKLRCRNVLYLPNFVFFATENEQFVETILHGTAGKRIICLANLRLQKNHFLLLEVAKMAQEYYSDWSFHLVGIDFNDAYSKELKKQIVDLKLEKSVFIYGSRNDIKSILEQSDLAVLTSNSEGLPVSLLEYGYYKMPVICTDVGQISDVLQDGANGVLVDPGDATGFYSALVDLIANPQKRDALAESLNAHVARHYGAKAIITAYLSWLDQSITSNIRK